MTFQLLPHYNVNAAPIEPELMGHFCIKQDENGVRQYDPGLTHLKYFKRPPRFDQLSFDLNFKYDNIRRKASTTNDEYVLYQWIVNNFKEVYKRDNDGRWSTPDFVCFRGLLTCLFCTVQDWSEAWSICAVKFDNVIYLAQFKTEYDKKRKAMQTDMDIRRCTWGYKFEQFVMADSPMKDPNPEKLLDESEEFCCMFQSKFGNNMVLYGAEIDGIESKEEIKDSLKGKPIKLVELKTNRLLDTHWKVNSFNKYKSLKWWAQSHLVGINTIVCGLRDEDGIVHCLKEFSLNEIAFNSRRIWNENYCRKFCSAFLEHIKKTVTKNYDKCLYKFEWDPKKHSKTINMRELDPNCEFSFLPEWYINQITALKKAL